MPSYVNLGNKDAIEAYRDPGSPDPEELKYREVPGERTTTIIFTGDPSLQEMLQDVDEIVSHHFAQGKGPVWVESDGDDLTRLLCERYGIPKNKNRRPKTWGNTLDEDVAAAAEGDSE